MAVAALAPLPEQENNELLKCAKGGDDYAKERFFAHNYRLMVYIARKFENTGIMLDDLIGMCQIGFLKAYNTFDFAKEIKFATYSTRCMENEVLMFLRKHSKRRGEVSLDEPLNVDVEGNALTHADVFVAGDPEQELHREQIGAVKEVLAEFMKKAKTREVEILRLYYWESMTQREIAEHMGISQSYISRLQKRIETKLRKVAHKQGIIDNREGNVIKMATINKGYMKHIFETTALNNGQIASIVGCSAVMVGKHRQKYDGGKMTGTKADDGIQPKIDAFIASLTGDERRRMEERFKRKASPVTVTKEADKSSEVRVTYQEPTSPASASTTPPPAEEPPAAEPPKQNTVMEAALAAASREIDAGMKQAAATTEDEIIAQRMATPPHNRKPAITLTLDRVDASTIEAFLHTIRTQLHDGAEYRFHVQLEQK